MHTEASIQAKVRRYLEKEFEARSLKNSSYSLRAFARSLGVDPSYLSKVLNGKRQLSRRSLSGFVEKLSFPEEIQAELRSGPSATERVLKFDTVSVDEFRLIADWYHYAILELTHLDDFRADAKWISLQLGIPHGQAFAALERLKRMRLLVQNKAGVWSCSNNSTTAHRFSDVAFRQLQRQILEQAIEALERVPMEERDQSSITMCVSEERLEAAKEKIRKFRRELMKFLEGGESRDRVYQLSVSLFPVSQKLSDQKKSERTEKT